LIEEEVKHTQSKNKRITKSSDETDHTNIITQSTWTQQQKTKKQNQEHRRIWLIAPSATLQAKRAKRAFQTTR
jgi:hypothetical protein